MSVLGEFAAYQTNVVNADRDQIVRARARRDAFRGAFMAEPDVEEVFCSGSLRRGTQLKPIHDVDMVVVYRREDWPSWGLPGPSSEEAIRHAKSQVNVLLSATNGTYEKLVRYALASRRGRSVKCFIDTTDTTDADAFTVDVMPALRNNDGTLELPGQRDRFWTTANPKFLIEEVRTRQQVWNKFCPTVRLLKLWAREQVDTEVKSLLTEVLALHHLPTGEGNVPEALRKFFTAAAARPSLRVEDPARYCEPIQRQLDETTLREALALAADHAQKAIDAAADNDQHTAISHWRDVLGPDFAPGHDDRRPPTQSGIAAPRPIRDAPQG